MIATDVAGHVRYVEDFLREAEADHYFRVLRDNVPWRQEEIVMFGRRVRLPRLTAWYGDADAFYTYSGLRNEPLAWTAPLLALRERVNDACGVCFNSALLNRYGSGDHGMSWHSDDEPELGAVPVIASVSLGAPRLFVMRSKAEKRRVLEQRLAHGSLLIMQGDSQKHFQHAVPKEKRALGERINLTFRMVSPTTAMRC